MSNEYFLHDSSCVDENVKIGKGTKIWHYCHISSGAEIGEQCTIGQNVYIGDDVIIGNNVKIQNTISIYSGTVIEDDVFLGPSCVFTNVSNPRAQVKRRDLYERTLVRRGATIGANSTIVCGATLGRYCFIGAGSVVIRDAEDYALVVGNPGRRIGWMSRHGHRLIEENGTMICPESGFRYNEIEPGVLRCQDLSEDAPLPADLAVGKKPYREIKRLRK
jgi:UDP-2-acetamido-3-amino-2,3-dideoxy-glucuronate N-acetyltransferase